MKCPCCKTELVEWKMLRLETLDEHVCRPSETPSLKMAYVCPNKQCLVNIRPSLKVFWEEDGGLYTDMDTTSNETFKADRKYFESIPFIDGNESAFGSIERQLHVEIYKKDENKRLFVVPSWFPIRKGWKCNKIYNYKSNKNGEILRRSWRLEWVRNDGVIHISGWRMIKFEIRTLFRSYVQILKNPSDKNYYLKRMQETVERSKWERAEWWRKVGGFMAKTTIGFVNIATE